MPDPQLESLFQNTRFLADLRRAAALSEAQLRRVRDVLLSREKRPDKLYSDEETAALGKDIGIDTDTARRVLALSVVFAGSLQAGSTSSDELKAAVKTALKDQRDLTALYDHLQHLGELGQKIEGYFERRAVVLDGGRTVNEISVVCDLRLRTRDVDGSVLDVASYRPEIQELVPLAIVRISFESADHGEDCVFQLTPSELEQFSRQLLMAKKEVDAAVDRISLRTGQ
jgi:hypothetical protein